MCCAIWFYSVCVFLFICLFEYPVGEFEEMVTFLSPCLIEQSFFASIEIDPKKNLTFCI